LTSTATRSSRYAPLRVYAHETKTTVVEKWSLDTRVPSSHTLLLLLLQRAVVQTEVELAAPEVHLLKFQTLALQ